jgi:hypothetical protein
LCARAIERPISETAPVPPALALSKVASEVPYAEAIAVCAQLRELNANTYQVLTGSAVALASQPGWYGLRRIRASIFIRKASRWPRSRTPKEKKRLAFEEGFVGALQPVPLTTDDPSVWQGRWAERHRWSEIRQRV